MELIAYTQTINKCWLTSNWMHWLPCNNTVAMGVLLPDLLQTGLPMLTEKPLARSVQVGEYILEKAKKSKGSYFVGYHKRSDPAVMYAKKEIERLRETGELGKMKYIRITMPAGDWIAGGFDGMIGGEKIEGLEFDPPASDMDTETYAAYDSFVNYYIHQVNLMRHLLGEDYEVTYAEPTGVLLALRSASGIAGTIEMTPYRTTLAWQEETLVAFEKGFIRIAIPAPLASFRAGEVTLYRDPGNGVTPIEIKPQMPWIHAFRQQAINFLAAVRGESTPLCTAEDAFKDLLTARNYILLKNK